MYTFKYQDIEISGEDYQTAWISFQQAVFNLYGQQTGNLPVVSPPKQQTEIGILKTEIINERIRFLHGELHKGNITLSSFVENVQQILQEPFKNLKIILKHELLSSLGLDSFSGLYDARSYIEKCAK